MESLLIFLLWLCVYAVVIYVVIFLLVTVFATIGFAIPARVVQLLYLIGTLVLLIYLVSALPTLGPMRFPR